MCNESTDADLELSFLEVNKFSAVLIGPLVTLVNDFTYPTLKDAEDVLLGTLRSHRGLDERFVKVFLLHSLPHMVVGYLLLLAAVITLIVFLCAVFHNCCSKTHGKPGCGELCFFFEGLFFVIVSGFLLLGVVSQLQIAVRLDTALQTLPVQAGTALAALGNLRNSLHQRVEELGLGHEEALDFAVHSVAELPLETTKLATKLLGTLANRSQHLSTEIRRHLQEDINVTDVMIGTETALSTSALAIECVSGRLATLAHRVRSDEQLPSETRLSLAGAIETAQEAAHVEMIVSGLPTWGSESAALSAALDDLLPAIAMSAHIEEHAPVTLLELLESHVLSELRLRVYEARVLVNETASDIAKASDALLPRRWCDKVAMGLQKWHQAVVSLDVNSWRDGSTTFSGRTLLLLMPGVHGILTLLVASAAVAVSVTEIRRHRAMQSPLFLHSGRSLGASLLWVTGMFAASLLWLHLLLAGGVQLLSYGGSTACQPTLDLRIFRDFLDDPEVWGGKTYLDMHLSGGAYKNNTTKGKSMRNLLDNCRRRQNLMVALGIDLSLTLSKQLERKCLCVNASLLERTLDDGLLAVKWLSTKQISDLQMVLQQAHDAINLSVMEQVTSSFVNVTASNVTGRHLRPLLLTMPRDPTYDYIQEEVHQVVEDITRLETDLLPKQQAALVKLAELQTALAVSMQLLQSLSDCADNTSMLLHNSVRPQTRALVQSCAALANERMRDWRRSVALGVGAELGSCHAIYDAFVFVTSDICGEGLTLMNALWITHTLMAAALMAMMLLSCHLGVCLRGARVRYLRTRLLLQSKIAEQRIQEALSVTSIQEIVVPREDNDENIANF